MIVESRLIKEKLIGFLKYEFEPYIFYLNKISEYIRNKSLIDFKEDAVIFKSCMRSSERLFEAIVPLYTHPLVSAALLVDGFGNHLALLNYYVLNNRKKSI